MWGHGWLHDASVTISVDFSEVGTATTDSSGYFGHQLDPAVNDLVVGSELVVDDGVHSTSHTITEVELQPFAVTVTDGGIAGGEDRFEIRVAAPGESPFSGEPLYQATGDLQGGEIKIHQP